MVIDERWHKPEMLWEVLRESGGYRRDGECFLNAQFVPDIWYHIELLKFEFLFDYEIFNTHWHIETTMCVLLGFNLLGPFCTCFHLFCGLSSICTLDSCGHFLEHLMKVQILLFKNQVSIATFIAALFTTTKVKVTQGCADRYMSKWNMAQTSTGTLFSLKNEGNSDTRYKMHETWAHYAEWDKSWPQKDKPCVIPLKERP